MSDLTNFQKGQMEGARHAGVTVTETSQLIGLSKQMISNVTAACTQGGKTSVEKQNSGQKQQLSEIDRRILKRIKMSKKETTAVKMTTKLNEHLKNSKYI